jgi:hypothetical protein
MPSSSYDAVILGDGLSSLITAALCARRGLRTLHVTPEEYQERYSVGPHRLPIEPMLWPGKMAWAGERVLKELTIELALRRKLREPKVFAQVVAPDLRFELGDSMAKELAREVGAERGEQWAKEWQALAELGRPLDPLMTTDQIFPQSGFFHREVVRIIEKTGADAEQAWRHAGNNATLAAIARAIAVLWTRHPDPPPVAIARALEACRGGVLPLRGDGDALREMVLEKLVAAGGEARVGKVRELHTSWGKISAVTIGNDEIGAGQVIAAIPPREVAALLGKKAPKKLVEQAESRVVGYRYTFNIVLDAAGVPDAMAPTVFVLDDPSKPPHNDNAFSIHCGEPDDSGRVVVSLAALVASSGPLDDETQLARARQLRVQLLTKLDDVMPFYDHHVVVGHSPHDGLPPSAPGGRGVHEAPKGMPLKMRPVLAGDAESNAGTAGTAALSYSSSIKNLTFAGAQILPMLGLEGELAAAWSAAKIAAGLAGKKRDYLRDEVVA